jgi:hypothetical protein
MEAASIGGDKDGFISGPLNVNSGHIKPGFVLTFGTADKSECFPGGGVFGYHDALNFLDATFDEF